MHRTTFFYLIAAYYYIGNSCNINRRYRRSVRHSIRYWTERGSYGWFCNAVFFFYLFIYPSIYFFFFQIQILSGVKKLLVCKDDVFLFFVFVVVHAFRRYKKLTESFKWSPSIGCCTFNRSFFEFNGKFPGKLAFDFDDLLLFQPVSVQPSCWRQVVVAETSLNGV